MYLPPPSQGGHGPLVSFPTQRRGALHAATRGEVVRSWNRRWVSRPHGTPYPGGGENTAARVDFIVNLLVFLLILLVHLLIFWDWIACKLITLFVIFLHVVIRTCMCFFFEVPRIEELQDPGNSPGREEVGRRTLGDHGGFLLPFFCRARFRLLTRVKLAR